MALRTSTEASISTNGQTSKADDHKATMKTRIEQDLGEIWLDLKQLQDKPVHVNTESAISLLYKAQISLDKGQDTKAMYYALQARSSLTYARQCSEEIGIWRIVPVLIEIMYIALLIGLFFYLVLQEIETPMANVDTQLHIPSFVFFWGFLGGVAYCMYGAALWSRQHLFDRHYIAWYLAHPWISALMGGAVSLIIYGGLRATTASESSGLSPSGNAALALISFVSGFSTRSMWKLLDRAARRVLQDAPSSQQLDETVKQELETDTGA